MDGYGQRFGGVERLYGAAGLARLRAAHVAVVGLGGVGSWVAEALARSGVGALTLLDLDDICRSNTNRQVHALETTIGRPKVAAMAERLRAINPDLTVHPQAAFYTEATSAAFFAVPYSAVVDAIDSVRHKAHLLAEARRRGVPVVTVGGAGGRRDCRRIQCGDLSRSSGDRLLMLTRKRLRARYGFPRVGKGKFGIPCVWSDEPPRYPWRDGSLCATREPGSEGGLDCGSGLGSVTHVTATMGLFAAGLVIEGLATEPTPAAPRA